jgi:RyR domain
MDVIDADTDTMIIAKVCHEVNRGYCEAIGDKSQPPWDEAPEWQKKSAVTGVQFKLDNPDATAEDQHQSWLDGKAADGWIYGAVKDPAKKEHPAFLPYANLPQEQKIKDHLFAAVVEAMR